MTHPLLSSPAGSKHLLLGNEAIVRGALEAGVGFVSCYPGTPSSEVPDTFYRLSREGEFSFEYSVNEKVALEVGGGASLGGVPTLVTMKHVGLNVAADPLMSLAYVGTPGGLVILNADDPGAHSSQNEQDNRYYFRLAGVPSFEPATAQEAKDMMRDALLASAKWEHPVILRTTTRINHLRGIVTLGRMARAKNRGEFSKDPSRFVLLPAVARRRHPALLQKMDEIVREVESSPWNRVTGQGELGIIASGISRAYLQDALEDHGLRNRFRIFELGLSYPLPERALSEFLSAVSRVLILEELEPVLENEIRALCQKNGLSAQVWGKEENLTRIGEYSTREVAKSLFRFSGGQAPKERLCPAEPELPGRPPNLCAGCAHRAVYYAVRKTFGEEAIYSMDIGCYTLGFLPPHRAADFLFCMGSSISGGTGASRATGRPVVAYIGDSTFFHSGLTGLVNAVHNEHDLLLVILDNQTTAMTGHQPHPGVEQTAFGANRSRVDIEQIVRGCGVEQVRKVKPLQVKKTLETLQELKDLTGVRVLIAEEPCVLFARRTLGTERKTVARVEEQSRDAFRCLEELACPAFYLQEGEMRIDDAQCAGCMVCVQISEAIKPRKRSTQ